MTLPDGYTIDLERFRASYTQLEPLYRKHYAEMQERLAGQGIPIGPYKPRLDRYEAASEGGWLLTFVLRHDGEAVGYSNVYLTNDMHNGELIAQEDTIYVVPEHRNGIGKKLTLHILDDLRRRRVKRADVMVATDPRVGKMLGRIGFRPKAQTMTITF